MGGLTEEQIRLFHQEGYVIVRGALAPDELAGVIAEFEAVIDQQARELHASGVLDSIFAEHGFATRLARISEHTPLAFRALFSGAHRGPALFDLLRHPTIIGMMESLLGPEIMCHPAYRVRPKLPDLPLTHRLTVVPWHQDAAYIDPAYDRELYVTVWLALTEATAENGCMELMPRVHTQGILPHRNVRKRNYLDIPPQALPDMPTVLATARPGDAVLMTNLTPHRSLPNRTGQIRWSVDARYHHADVPSGYPPEAGFLVHSRRNPAAVVSSVHEFEQIRLAHQPGPAHRWIRWPTEEPA